MSVGTMLNKTCTIRRPTYGQSSSTKGQERTSVSDTTSVACAVQPANQAESMMGQRETGVTEYNVYFAATTDVKNKDLLISITGMTNVTLEVTSNATDGVGRGFYTKVTAKHKVGFGQ